MKYFSSFLLILTISFCSFGSYVFAQEECSLQSGPATSLSEYSREMTEALREIEKNVQNTQCKNRAAQRVNDVIGVAWANISTFNLRYWDFLFRSDELIESKGNKNPAKRDEKIFQDIQKQIYRTTQNLAKRCALEENNKKALRKLIQDNHELSQVYKKTVLGKAPATMGDIPEKYRNTWEGIRSEYTPDQLNSCDTNEQAKDIGKTLSNIIRWGSGKERAFETWQKAIALFNGGGFGVSPSDYRKKQRQLLEDELSRQGLSSNTKTTILGNFDCLKTEVGDSDNPIEIMKARATCLSYPIIGVDKVFSGWKKSIDRSKTTIEYASRKETMATRMERTIDVAQMYNNLLPLISSEIETDNEAINGVIGMHIELLLINDLLEKRIKPMQKNCMKGQPSIVGGCRN